MLQAGRRLCPFLSSWSSFSPGRVQTLQSQPLAQAPVLLLMLWALRLKTGLSEPQLRVKHFLSTPGGAWPVAVLWEPPRGKGRRKGQKQPLGIVLGPCGEREIAVLTGDPSNVRTPRGVPRSQPVLTSTGSPAPKHLQGAWGRPGGAGGCCV